VARVWPNGKILLGNLDGEIPFEKPRGTWEDNIKMDLNVKRIWRCGLDSRASEQNSESSCKDGNEP
jgi:hypothetical protein